MVLSQSLGYLCSLWPENSKMEIKMHHLGLTPGWFVLDSWLVIDSCMLLAWNGKIKRVTYHMNIFYMYTCTLMYCSSQPSLRTIDHHVANTEYTRLFSFLPFPRNLWKNFFDIPGYLQTPVRSRRWNWPWPPKPRSNSLGEDTPHKNPNRTKLLERI